MSEAILRMKEKWNDENTKRSISAWASLVSCIMSSGALAVLWNAASWKGNLDEWKVNTDANIESIAQSDNQHHESEKLHMPYTEKFRIFVTREEWSRQTDQRDAQLSEIKATGIRTEAKIERIYEILRKN